MSLVAYGCKQVVLQSEQNLDYSRGFAHKASTYSLVRLILYILVRSFELLGYVECAAYTAFVLVCCSVWKSVGQ